MALTRPELRKIGVTEKEMLDFIMDEHNLALDAVKDSLTTATTDLATAKKRVKELEDAVPTDSNGDGTDWKAECLKVQGEFDTYKANVETEKTTAAKTAKLEKLLVDKYGANPKYAAKMAREFKLDDLKDDGDGFKDFDKALEPVKAEWPDMFGTTNTEGFKPATPPASSGGVLNPFTQEHFSLEAQTKLFRENPALAREMAATVGIKID